MKRWITGDGELNITIAYFCFIFWITKDRLILESKKVIEI
jgi:hypothetical protein